MEEEKRVPTIDEILGLPLPDDAQISPDGAYVAYTVRTPDWEENEYVWQVWLVNVDQAEVRQLTFAPQSSRSPRWSPDGRWLAFISKRKGDEHAQIYRLSAFGGEAERLTELETDVQAIDWSPDGTAIAYTAVPPESEAEKKRKETYGEYQVEDEDYRHAHLWLLELEGERVRRLTVGDAFHVTDFDWDPAGERIAFAAWPTPDVRDWDRSRVYLLDRPSLEVTPLTEEGYEAPRWSPDGTEIACTRVGSPTYIANNEIAILPSAGGEPRILAGVIDENVILADWGPEGIYFFAIQGTEIPLFCVDPASGRATRLTPEEPAGWVAMQASFAAGFERAATVGYDVDHYAEVVLLDLVDDTARRLTAYNDEIAGWAVGRREVFTWNSTDGTPIEGVLIKPADFDPQRRYPLLVVIHGGPSWTSLLGLLASGEHRYYPMLAWLDKGALILQPNYRGSAGYGEDFRALNVRNLGLGDYWDVISGVDALIERGWVDPDRVGAMGWSQGGYISAFIATYSDRFRAVSVGAGIANWTTYYVNTDIHPFTRQYLRATPWEEPEIYRLTSPIAYIRQAQTPTLIQHGEFDRRVPIPNAYELYQGLQDMGVESRLVVYKGMPHGITKPRLSRQVMQENLDWFNRWIWGEDPEEEPAPPCYIVPAGDERRPDEALLPARERFAAPAVEDVYHWARRDRADFRLFSGQLGLLGVEAPVPPGEHELSSALVSSLAARLAEQIEEEGWTNLVFYTAKAEEHPEVLVYLGCLQVAAGVVGGVTVEHREDAEGAEAPAL